MAARFWVGASGDWSDTAHWSLTTGGAGGAAVPSASDDVTFDGAGNTDCVLDTAVAKVAKTLTIASGYTSTLTYNVNLSVSGSITTANSAHTMTGAGLLRMIAAGTWTTNGKTIGVPVEIGGTTTFTATLAGALTVPALTLTNTTSTIFSGAFAITAASCAISGTQTVTIVAAVTLTGALTISDACVLNSFTWNVVGLVVTAGLTTGSSIINLTGGTWSGAGQIGCPLKFAGNVTVSGAVHIGFSGVAVTYVSGTITTAGSTLTIDSACTLDTAGMSWNAVTFSGAFTLTINSLLSATTLTLPNAAVTFAGSSGWTVGTFTNTTLTATRIWTFTANRTYTILTAMDTQHAAAQTVRFSWVSSTPGTRYTFILGTGATQDNGFIDATDADSSLGQTVFSFHGVLSNTLNWATAFLVNSGIARPAYQLGV